MLHELKLAVVGAFCAASLLNGARAEEPKHVEALHPAALVTAIYAKMDESRSETSNFVLASAETRIADLSAMRHAQPFPRPLVSAYVLAHLAP